jgi:deoxycytidine triphosphate deaminase
MDRGLHSTIELSNIKKYQSSLAPTTIFHQISVVQLHNLLTPAAQTIYQEPTSALSDDYINGAQGVENLEASISSTTKRVGAHDVRL